MAARFGSRSLDATTNVDASRAHQCPLRWRQIPLQDLSGMQRVLVSRATQWPALSQKTPVNTEPRVRRGCATAGTRLRLRCNHLSDFSVTSMQLDS